MEAWDCDLFTEVTVDDYDLGIATLADKDLRDGI